jgi:hypothetical protein
LLESSAALEKVKYSVLVLQPGLVHAVMAVPIVKPGSIAAIKEVSMVESVLVTEYREERVHRVAVDGQKCSLA